MDKENIDKNMKKYIFGAQAIALGSFRALKTLGYESEISGFIVSNKDGNPDSLEGLPVMALNDIRINLSNTDKKNSIIYICTPENVMDEIYSLLLDAGFIRVVRMTSLRWAHIQEQAFIRTNSFEPLASLPIGFEEASLQVYKAKFYKDQSLKGDYVYSNYFTDIQVGAACTNVRVAQLTDDQGDNISDKNGNYSELTGLYWIWKNVLDKVDENQYIGLAHYRRFLDLSRDDLFRLVDNNVDVVLPYPMPYVPSILEHPKRYLTDVEWNAVIQAIEEVDEEHIESFKAFFYEEYMYNYNIILARRDVLKKYCEWLFEILFKIEKIMEKQGLNMPHRYIGYIAEELESYYYMKRMNSYKIAHAGCRFLI